MKEQQKIINDVNKRVKRAARVEKICRKLCADNGIEPDKLVCKTMPEYINYPVPTFYVPNPQYTFPAWWLFKEAVEATIDLAKKMK